MHNREGAPSMRRMNRRVQRKSRLLQHLNPVGLVWYVITPKDLFDRMVEAFRLAVSLRVVPGRQRYLTLQ